jgi:hypothetical protein
VLDQLQRALAAEGAPPDVKLHQALRLLAKYRSMLVSNTLAHQLGTKVQDGPFAGMEFLSSSREGCTAPKLLGTYESELHLHIKGAIRRGYDRVVNIGSAEGYYAVGMALSLPDAEIRAYDIDERARAACRELAERNGVAERVATAGEFRGEDFDALAAEEGRTLVLCDIEGAERELLDPERYPGLKTLDLIVELHDVYDRAISQDLTARFERSHDMILIPHSLPRGKLPMFLQGFDNLDRLLAVWEWRSGPTPWVVMLAKEGADGA